MPNNPIYGCSNVLGPAARLWWAYQQQMELIETQMEQAEYALQNTHPDDGASLGFWDQASKKLSGDWNALMAKQVELEYQLFL